jgi:hypothetical protein
VGKSTISKEDKLRIEATINIWKNDDRDNASNELKERLQKRFPKAEISLLSYSTKQWVKVIGRPSRMKLTTSEIQAEVAKMREDCNL